MSRPIIAVDVDGVCADLHYEWLRRYNAEYNDTLTINGIHQWEMTLAVKPECGKSIYKYLSQPDLYENVPLIPGAIEGVRALREKGYRVVFVTSCTKGMTDQKWGWLERHGFLEAGSRGNADLVVAHDKSLINANLLIDDYDGNFTGWNGYGILFSAPYNVSFETPANIVRAEHWGEAVELVQLAWSMVRVPWSIT